MIVPTTTTVPTTTPAPTAIPDSRYMVIAQTTVTTKIVYRPKVTLSTTKTTVYPGTSYTLSWNTYAATKVSLNITPIKNNANLNDIAHIVDPANDTVGTVYTYTANLYDEYNALVSTSTVTVTVIKAPSLTLSLDKTTVFSNDKFTLSWITSNDAPSGCYVNIPSIYGTQQLQLTSSVLYSYPTPGVYVFIGTLYTYDGEAITTSTVTLTVLVKPTILITGDSIVYPGDTWIANWISNNVIAGLSVTLVITQYTITNPVATIQNQPTTSTYPFNTNPNVSVGTVYTVTANLVDGAGNVIATSFVSVTVSKRPVLDIFPIDMLLHTFRVINPTLTNSRDYVIYNDISRSYMIDCYYTNVPLNYQNKAGDWQIYVKLNTTGDAHYPTNGGNLIQLIPGNAWGVAPGTTNNSPTNIVPIGTPPGTVYTYQAFLYKAGMLISTSNITTITVAASSTLTLTSNKSSVLYNNNESFTLSWASTNAPPGSYVLFGLINPSGANTPPYNTKYPTNGSVTIATVNGQDIDGINRYEVVLCDTYGRDLAYSGVCSVTFAHTPVPIQVHAWMSSEPYNRLLNSSTVPGQTFPFYVTAWGDNIPVGSYFTVPYLSGKYIFMQGMPSNQVLQNQTNKYFYSIPYNASYGASPGYMIIENYVPMGASGGDTFNGNVTFHSPDGTVLGSASTAGYDKFSTGYKNITWTDTLPSWNTCYNGNNYGKINSENCEFYNYNYPKPYWWTLPHT